MYYILYRYLYFLIFSYIPKYYIVFNNFHYSIIFAPIYFLFIYSNENFMGDEVQVI